MTDGDDKLARLYRALPKEEPPEALDAAILAAARRAASPPSLVRRWAVPVSVAAMLVIALGITLEMQHEVPGIEAPATQAPAPQAPAQLQAPAPPEAPKPVEAKPEREKRAAKPERAERAAKPAPEAASAISPSANSNVAAQPTRAAPAAAPAAAPQALERATRARSSSDMSATKRAIATDPASALEAVAKLREAGRGEEADRALDEFRRRYPDYRIDDATWERVKPR